MDTLPHEKQIHEYINTIEHLKKQNQDNPLFNSEIQKLEQKLKLLKENVYAALTPWQRVLICRHPSRPHMSDYIQNICTKFHELCGDRLFGDDHSIIGGLAQIGEMRCVVMGQEKGNNTETRLYRNFGMVNPEGFRKASRLMKLAEKFHLPLISLIDTPGANPQLEAEERGISWAIAQNLRDMSRIKVPIIIVLIGEGCSGGAIGIGVGDAIGMLEHAYYSVISPEGCASILWKDSKKSAEASLALKLNAENMLELQVIDAIIKEPLGGAHHDPQVAYSNVKRFILDQWETLKRVNPIILLEQRYIKFRALGRLASKETSNVSKDQPKQ